MRTEVLMVLNNEAVFFRNVTPCS